MLSSEGHIDTIVTGVAHLTLEPAKTYEFVIKNPRNTKLFCKFSWGESFNEFSNTAEVTLLSQEVCVIRLPTSKCTALIIEVAGQLLIFSKKPILSFPILNGDTLGIIMSPGITQYSSGVYLFPVGASMQIMNTSVRYATGELRLISVRQLILSIGRVTYKLQGYITFAISPEVGTTLTLASESAQSIQVLCTVDARKVTSPLNHFLTFTV